jgi:hypothetical protein
VNESARRARSADIRALIERTIAPEPVDGVVRVGHGMAFGWTFRLPAPDTETVDPNDLPSATYTHHNVEGMTR